MCAHEGDSDSDDEIKELEHQGQGDEIPPAHNSASASASEPGSDGPDQDDRETSRVKRRLPRDCVDKHSTDFYPGWVRRWVRRWDWLRPVYGSNRRVVGLLCHLCQKHRTTARNGSTKWSREPCMCMRVDSVQRHANSHQHAGSVAKEHALLASGDSDIGSILTSAVRKQISSNRQAIVGGMRSLYFPLKHSLPHTTLFGPFLDFCILQGCEYLSNIYLCRVRTRA